ncbi:MAG TPA: methyl-accepting chemotaxis protein [Gemmatimonadaceae bacterium]|nr:methyl-accepting chemotaxis protein [Gemmatimonadaceae bacterium]
MKTTFRFQTIRQVLTVGFSFLILLLVGAGAVGWISMNSMANMVSETLADAQQDAKQASDFSNVVTQEIQAANTYLSDQDAKSDADFRRLGWEAHRLQRNFSARQDVLADQIVRTVAIDTTLARVEAAFALSHRLTDLGRLDEAHAEAQKARKMVPGLLEQLTSLEHSRAKQLSTMSADLRAQATARSRILVTVIVIATLLAMMIVIRTGRAVGRPLRLLVRHAIQLSHGDLQQRTEGEMPGEFRTLADAMNHATIALSRIAAGAAKTADEVAQSASDLASASKQISASAGEVADAVEEVSHGAESQVAQLRQVNEALDGIRTRGDNLVGGAQEVHGLASAIEAEAEAKRIEIDRALKILFDVRTIVEQAAAQVRELNTSTSEINKFVVSVGRIAEQTNLLSLNAAIEAARAGEAGRGFGVVAGEVRKLADQTQAAADDVVKMTEGVTTRVTATSKAMEEGVTQVGEIERVSRELDSALSTILAAAERTRAAAATVTTAATENARAVDSAAANLGLVARTAESHATAAMQVSASTEEQSAACEQMSMASTQLFHGSHALKDLVGELKTDGLTGTTEMQVPPASAQAAPPAAPAAPPGPRLTPPNPQPPMKKVA